MNGLPYSTYLLAAAVATVVSGMLVRVLLGLRIALDNPNHRSLHSSPTPRTGGIGLLAGVLTGAVVSTGAVHSALWIALALAALSLVDDRWNLPAAVRLLGHLVAATVFVMMLADRPTLMLVPVLVLAIGWMTNLYNFMDGADGLAGGMTVFGFGAFAMAAGMQGHGEIAALSLCVAAAGVGFLLFNFPPARIFMGDVGSIPVGFLAGAIGLLGWQEGVWPAVFPLIVFAPFIVDASVTLAKRALRREKVWHAHREHYYQRLILWGWSHGRAAFAEYGLMAVCAAAGVYVVFADPAAQAVVVAILGLLLLVLMVQVDRRRPLQRPERA
ncbi:MAG TPA: glycosyltransferase family 4 protein [Burkholderiales bacterium]|nr:glycosyltransferase family 4 protein [Burkholderiales bacterium]